MKKTLIALGIGLFVSLSAHAGDVYRILRSDTLVTAHRDDLLTFMDLNSYHNKPAVRALYRQLAYRGLLINFQPGATVEVTQFYGDGTAQITGGGIFGYIATDDLTLYLGSRPNPGGWERVVE
jgi:hypothetical protein